MFSTFHQIAHKTSFQIFLFFVFRYFYFFQDSIFIRSIILYEFLFAVWFREREKQRDGVHTQFCNKTLLPSFYNIHQFTTLSRYDKVIVPSNLSCLNNGIPRSLSQVSSVSETKLKTLPVHRVHRSSCKLPARQVFPVLPGGDTVSL